MDKPLPKDIDNLDELFEALSKVVSNKESSFFQFHADVFSATLLNLISTTYMPDTPEEGDEEALKHYVAMENRLKGLIIFRKVCGFNLDFSDAPSRFDALLKAQAKTLEKIGIDKLFTLNITRMQIDPDTDN